MILYLLFLMISLGLGEMELILFMPAPIVLHFGFVIKTLFITKQCFGYC